MKAVVVITDSEAIREFEAACLASPTRGFTVLPQAWGRGRSGLHTGDRVHPGGTSVLFSVVPDAELPAAADALRAARDRSGAAEATKMFVFDAEEMV